MNSLKAYQINELTKEPDVSGTYMLLANEYWLTIDNNIFFTTLDMPLCNTDINICNSLLPNFIRMFDLDVNSNPHFIKLDKVWVKM